jgi:Zn-finger nucleic acid-binding protein
VIYAGIIQHCYIFHLISDIYSYHVVIIKSGGNEMKCPVDGTELVSKQKDVFTVHTCPKCEGVWLSRAELNKIIAQSEIDYPDITDFKGRENEPHFQSPGKFFGRIFEH